MYLSLLRDSPQNASLLAGICRLWANFDLYLRKNSFAFFIKANLAEGVRALVSCSLFKENLAAL